MNLFQPVVPFFISFVCLFNGFLFSSGDTVSQLELKRYVGTWYEIARLPTRFEDGLVGVTANYAYVSDDKLSFVNSGFRETFSGSKSQVSGSLKMPNTNEPGRLRIMIFNLFPADYWIHELDTDYRYSLVGVPSRKSLWIFSRIPNMSEGTYARLVEKARRLGYDTSRLIRVEHQTP